MRTKSRLLSLCLPAIIVPSFLGPLGCDATSPEEDTSSTSASATTVSPNEKTACGFFVGKGLTPVQAAGIVGNLQQESNVDPRSVQYGGGPGRGIAQWSVGDRWDSGRTDSATAFARSRGADVWSLPLQLDFIWYELTTYPAYGLARLRAATDVGSATVAFQDLYEICGACNESNRVAQARAVLAVCGQGSSGGGGDPSAVSCGGLEDGAYCGGHDIAGDPGRLYTCRGGSLAGSSACASGCTRNPGSQDDACAPAECPGTSGGTVGAIHEKYVSLGACGSVLGGPTTAETGTPDGVGRYNVFQTGSIYWTARTGAFEVHGAIRDKWAAVGWEAGVLGYPTSDEYAVAGGRQSDFEHGSIRFDASSGQTTVTRK